MANQGEARLRVVIADDTEDVRSLLQYTFDLDGRFEVVAQAANGAEAVAAAASHQPDAVVLDLAMPVLDGLAAIPRIKRVSPATRIVVLSGFGARHMVEQAKAVGADSYVEKTTFQKLTSVLLDVCRQEDPRAAEGQSGLEQPLLAEPPALLRDDPTERLLRHVRWVAVLFALLQFWLYRPPAGVRVPFPARPTGLLVAGVLVAVNVLSRHKPFPWVAMVADAVVVVAVITLFSFDAASVLWTLLLVPIIEGAMRGQLKGALATWAATGAVYVGREVWAFDHYGPPRHLSLESFTYQLGVLLLVTVATGHLAASFARTSEQHRRSGIESERRAELLGLVASASRRLAALDVDQLLGGVVDAAAAFGFEGVELCRFDDAAATWSVAGSHGMEGTSPTPLSPPLLASVRAKQATVLVQFGDGRPDDPARPENNDSTQAPSGPAGPWQAAGFHSVAATPIFAGTAVAAALVAGTRRPDPVTAPEIECLELLAAQAGVGMANVRLLERTRHQALHDSLTGLPNQLLFEDRVAQALTQGARSGTRVALLFADLDRFKKVNDTLGHDFGNELLRQVAGRLLGAVRAGDTVARMGGDEFTLLLPGLASDKDACAVAAKVVDALRMPFMVGEHQLFVSASVGIAVYPSDGLRYESLLKHADIAMYRAKAAGGMTWELYASHSDEEVAYPRLTLEADLHMAMPRHELRVVYQPQIDLTEGGAGGMVGVEALIRWRHPELGDIAPTEFLPLAEEAGLIGTLDTWVLQTACDRAAQWCRQCPGGLRVAVNVSARQLQHPRFAESVMTALRRSGLPPTLLELEVTEGTAVTEVHGVRDALFRLRAIGVRVAIDDFGTGYSMLSRLRDFPLDTLKIDRSFIAEIRDANDDAPIVSATIAMARSLGLEVVAEGVEEEAQLGFLRHAGCDVAQGFLLSRPVEADDVIDLLVGHTAAATR
ncbi:MAG: hypothetical protein QOK43_2031 [Acidimicrobiaceae bacterium]|nr:hypothetical protein [Acidimicrobiaceae bacterium]